MRIVKEGKFIYFENVSRKEFFFLKRLLSLEEGYIKKYPVYFLWEDKEKKRYYTYKGFFDLIIERYKKKFKQEPEIVDNDSEYKVSIVDVKNKVGKLGNFELRDYQLLCVAKAIYHRFGAVQVATAGGKSLIMGAIAKYLEKPTLFITPTIQLAQQLYENLIKYGFDINDLSYLKGTNVQIKKYNIAVVNTVYNLIKKDNNIFSNIKVVMYDEAHRQQSDMYRYIDKHLSNNVEFSLGFTGSLFRTKCPEAKESPEDFVSFGLLGKPIITIDLKFLMKKGYVTKPVIYVDYGGLVNIGNVYNWHLVLEKAIIKNKERNKKIADWVSYFYDKDMTVLVLVDRISHIENIFSFLPDQIKSKTICLLGGKKALVWNFNKLSKISIDYKDVIKQIEEGYFPVVFGTTVLKEGTDIPAVDTVILGYVGKSLISVVQKIGRGLRKRKDKTRTFIIDFYDDSHFFVKKHSLSRIDFYKNQDFSLYFYNVDEDKRKFYSEVESELVFKKSCEVGFVDEVKNF